jgi:protein Mpv17
LTALIVSLFFKLIVDRSPSVVTTKNTFSKQMFNHFAKRGRHLLKKAFSHKYLLFTNVAISVSLSGVGDIIEQHYEILKNEVDEWDRTRTRHMSISGMTVGVFCHNWYVYNVLFQCQRKSKSHPNRYKYLDKHLPGRTINIVMKKVVIDQLIASPIVIMLFFLTLGVLKRSTICDIQNEIKHKAIRLYTAEWVVWPPAQIFNFYLLPTKYRVLYDNTISLGIYGTNRFTVGFIYYNLIIFTGYDVYTSYVINEKIDYS